MKNDLCERLFEFAVAVIKFLKTMPYSPENKTIRISLREMRESNYWLRIIKRTVKDVNLSEMDYLIKESGELKNILGSIVQKSRE